MNNSILDQFKTNYNDTKNSDDFFVFSTLMGKIKEEYGESIYSNWFANVAFKSLDNAVLTITAPSKFVREWIISNYFTRIQKILTFFGSVVQKIDIIVENHNTVDPNNRETHYVKHNGTIHTPENNPFITEFDDRFSFDNFVVDHSNKIAFVASQMMADVLHVNHSSMMHANLLFIHSNVGMGKTHLLRAIGHNLQNDDQNKIVGYLSAEKFMHHYMMAVRSNNLIVFKEHLRSLDILLFDDLQFICDKNSTQKEFANTINALMEAGKKIVIACDRSPYHLELDIRTKSRISGGIIAEIVQADLSMRQRVLNQQKNTMNIEIDDNIIDYLAANISSNIRELEGSLNKLITHCSLNEIPITMEVCQNILRDCLQAHEQDVSVHKIIQVVSDINGVAKSEILSKSRLSKLVYLRQMVAYVAKNITKSSLQEIGKYLGGKDHATIIYYIKQFEQKIERKPSIKSELDNIEKLVTAHLM